MGWAPHSVLKHLITVCLRDSDQRHTWVTAQIWQGLCSRLPFQKGLREGGSITRSVSQLVGGDTHPQNLGTVGPAAWEQTAWPVGKRTGVVPEPLLHLLAEASQGLAWVGYRKGRLAAGSSKQLATTCGSAHLGNLPWSLGTCAQMILELRVAGTQPLCIVHVISETLPTLTKSLSVLGLQNWQLQAGETYQLLTEMRLQGCHHHLQVWSTLGTSISPRAKTEQVPLEWLITIAHGFSGLMLPGHEEGPIAPHS